MVELTRRQEGEGVPPSPQLFGVHIEKEAESMGERVGNPVFMILFREVADMLKDKGRS